jgi:hypothetical protein
LETIEAIRSLHQPGSQTLKVSKEQLECVLPWDIPAVVGAATPVGDFSKGIVQFEDAIA